MDYGPIYQPQSVAPILERAAQVQVPLVSQPTGFSNALPALGGLAQTGFDVASQNKKKQSVMEAQQAYSQYLAKVDDGTATQQDHAMGRMAALSLGITPPDTLGMNLKKSEIDKNNAQTNVLKNKPGPISEDQKISNISRETSARYAAGAGGQSALTPQEMNALRLAARRSNNPLPVSMVNFKGPRAKIIAQSLMEDPNWSPVAGEQSLNAAKATGRMEGGKGFEIASNVGSLDDTLRQMEPLVKNLSPTSLQILNNAWQKGLAQTNDPQANQVLALANSARGLYSQVIAGGAGTQESDKKANETIARGLNSTGFQGMKAAVMAEGYSRASRMTGATPNTLDKPSGYIDQPGAAKPHPQDSQAVQWAKANPNDPRAAKIISLNGQ